MGKIISILLLTLLVVYSNCCATNEEQCGSDCFIATEEYCTSLASGNILCSLDESVCNAVNGASCYDTSDFDCPQNNQGSYILCGKGLEGCGEACYNASEFICTNGELTAIPCLPGELWCNGACYTPGQLNCLPSDFGLMLCPIGQIVCNTVPNKAVCYDPNDWDCVQTLITGNTPPVYDGTSATSPASSCTAVLLANSGASSGIYYIQYDPSTVLQVYCDFSMFPGRGATLLYKASNGVAGDPYAIWLGGALNDASPSTPSLLNLYSNNHYVSRIQANYWSNVVSVNVTVNVGGVPKQYIVFNTFGEDNLSWFDSTKWLSSSWLLPNTPGYTEPYSNAYGGQYFDIAGQANRRWYINQNWGGCPNDAGWLMLQYVNPDACESYWFDGDHEKLVVYYNPLNSVANIMTKFEIGDSFTVFGEVLPTSNCNGHGVGTVSSQCVCQNGFTGSSCTQCSNSALTYPNCQLQPGYLLCDKGFEGCGLACYDPTLYVCNNNIQLIPTPCAPGQKWCGQDCFDPTEEYCSNTNEGTILCPLSLSMCDAESGAICYDIDEYNCVENVPGCAKTHTVVSGDTCFQIAIEYSLTLSEFYDLNLNALINSGCDNLALGQVVCVAAVDPTLILCPEGELGCAGACYFPSQFVCDNGVFQQIQP